MFKKTKDPVLSRKYRGFGLSGRLSEPLVTIRNPQGQVIEAEAESFKEAQIIVDSYISGELIKY